MFDLLYLLCHAHLWISNILIDPVLAPGFKYSSYKTADTEYIFKMWGGVEEKKKKSVQNVREKICTY